MQLVIFNTTASPISFLSGAITVAANSSTAITNTTQQLALSTDGFLRSNIFANNVYLSDGTNNFGATDGLNYLYELVQFLGPTSDGLGNNITSTLVGSKQSLDSNITQIAPFSDKTATGTLAASNAATTLPINGLNALTVDVSGTWVGIITFEVTINGTTWFSTTGTFLDLAFTPTTNTSINGQFIFFVGGFVSFRARMSSYTSGTATIVINASATGGPETIRLEDGSGNPITSTTINSKQRLDVDLSSEGADNTTAPFGTMQIGGMDPTGKLQTFQTIPSGEQFVRDVLNVSSQYRAQSVTTTAAEALGGATILVNRKLLCITPTNGTIYWGTNSSVTTTTGAPLFPNNTLFISCTDNSQIWVISATTTDVRISEFS